MSLRIAHIKKIKSEPDPEVKKLADRLRKKWEAEDFEKFRIKQLKKAK